MLFTCRGRWNEFRKGTSERGTACLWQPHASLPLPFPSISLLNTHSAHGLEGSGMRWGRWGKSPGMGETCECAETPQRGSLPILVISDWRVCQEPIQLQLWTTTSIIYLLRCLQWWSTGQLIGYKASLWGLKSWINSQVSAFVFLQVALPSITEFENGNKHLMSSTPYNTQYGLQAPPPATHS